MNTTKVKVGSGTIELTPEEAEVVRLALSHYANKMNDRFFDSTDVEVKRAAYHKEKVSRLTMDKFSNRY